MFSERPHHLPQNIALVLLPELTMMPAASIIESARLANHLCEQELYKWSVHSVDGRPVAASNNMITGVNGDLSDIPCDSIPIVCSGLNVRAHLNRQFLDWLADAGQRFTDVGAVCTGAYSLAEAGLLDGYNCTLHWESLQEFSTSFPKIKVTGNLFEVDRNRFTCAGGTTALDMMLAAIAGQHGSPLAIAVAESMIHSSVRRQDERQPIPVAARMRTSHPKLLMVIKEMKNTLDRPIKPGMLASRFGLSTRQLERLFQHYVGRSPKRHHLDLRLQKAHRLLLKTRMPVADIAAACGFYSPSHFSRRYKAVYNRTPYTERAIPEHRTEARSFP